MILKKYKYLVVVPILLVSAICCPQRNEKELPPWEIGMMDVHHINTGRGDAAFAILPDGTTLLIDAGDMSETHPRTVSARNAPRLPNGNKTAPGWIVDYIKQFFPKGYRKKLDYALITHYHDDHFGELDSLRIKAVNGDYLLTGITEIGHEFPIKKILDRGFSYPINLRDTVVQKQKRFQNDAYGMLPTLKNYWKFLKVQYSKNGLLHEQLVPGQNNQIVLVNEPMQYKDFQIRNVAVNGTVWTGVDNDTLALFSKGDYPGENNLSTCIKISYGKFDYFTGGDISGVNGIGATDSNSVESHIAPVVGAVNVATLNHHGNRDSQNDVYVRTLRPRVWIQQNWSSDHPGDEVLRRITSKELYPGERDIFSNVMLQANKDVIGGALDQYKSQNGHIVLRVRPKGNFYTIFILDDTSAKREIIATFGPYEAR